MNERVVNKKILIVDDNFENRKALEYLITDNIDSNIIMTGSGEKALSLARDQQPALILLDIIMPDMDGYEVAQCLKASHETAHIPIIFITGKKTMSSKSKALQSGGIDYVTKPFNDHEILAIIEAQLKIKAMHDELIEKNKLLADREFHLTRMVNEKTRKIENITYALIASLENVNKLNDLDTGKHNLRVSKYAELLARECGGDNEFVYNMKLYASLHDVGKVGMPDILLKKPGSYTDEEMQIMRDHVSNGILILAHGEIDVMAKNIVQYHHERWDGSGYLEGLKGTQIPLEARIVALADVFDALVNKRCYKMPYSDDEAYEIIKEESGKHFDPRLVEIFVEKRDEILKIKRSLMD